MALGQLNTPRYIQYSELRDAENHPDGNEDIFNRPAKDFFTSFTVQHDFSTGIHSETGCMIIEPYTYTGDGVDPQNVVTQNVNLVITFLMIWREDTQYPVFYSSDMTPDNTKELETNAFQSDMIQSVGTGTFQVGADAAVNENLIDYFYLAIGTV